MNDKALLADQTRIIRERMRHELIAAVPVPFDRSGAIDFDAQSRYAQWMNEQPAAGVAVWVHTGRGLHLDLSQRDAILRSWRSALPGKLVIAGVGGNAAAASDADYIESAVAMAKHAISLGADALLAFAPTRFRDRDESDRSELILAYHRALAEPGLPLILFYLYEAAGGISYSEGLLQKLFALPNIVGIKMATLDSVMTFQNVANFLKQHFPEQLLITGEDRFFGYSLMLGAESALVGMGSARTRLQLDMMQTYFASDLDQFKALSAQVDRFAQCTFTLPMEGYIARMLYVLASDGVIPSSGTHDPWGPPISIQERTLIETFLIELDAKL